MATILELSDHSLTLFREMVSLESLSVHENEVSRETWQDEICRLEMWVSNTGANELGLLSMEYRLRNSPLLYYQIVKLFERLQDLLTDLKEVLDDEHIGDGVYDGEHGEVLEESEHDISHSAEIQHIHKGLREIISYLNRMSPAVLRVPYDDEVAGTDKLQASASSNTPPLASSLLVLTKVALQASQSLYTIMSARKLDRTTCELREGLATLINTLEALEEVDFEHEATLLSLKLPLCHCAKVCRELEGIISSDPKHSPDWAELNGKKIDLQNLEITLAEYNATICIALGLVTLQKSKATMTVIDEYRNMIFDIKLDLYNHLVRLENCLSAIEPPKAPSQPIGILPQDKMIEERTSIQQCLDICSRAHTYVNGIESRHQNMFPGSADVHGLSPTVVPSATQGGTLVDEQKRLSADLGAWRSQLASKLLDLNNEVKSLSAKNPQVSNEHRTRLGKIKEERDMLTQSLSLSAEPREAPTNDAFKDVLPESESQHPVVTTFGDLISAKKISSRPKSSWILGEVSNDSLRRLALNLELDGETR